MAAGFELRREGVAAPPNEPDDAARRSRDRVRAAPTQQRQGLLPALASPARVAAAAGATTTAAGGVPSN